MKPELRAGLGTDAAATRICHSLRYRSPGPAVVSACQSAAVPVRRRVEAEESAGAVSIWP